jgi:ribosomal-protein-alanine N-acetyltransferase
MSVVRTLVEVMDALSRPAHYLRPLGETDLTDVLQIESQVYNFPWSRQIFSDCMRVGYSCWAYIKDSQLVGYAILSVAVGEAHLLNICVDPKHHGEGLGEQFMHELFEISRELGAENLFLEVRPTNLRAVGLYRKLGFRQIGQRKDYYPGLDGREDAWVYSRPL